MKKLKLTYRPYTLELKHVFTVSSYSRSVTPIVLTEIEYDGIKGYGEGSMPVYLGESQESILKFLQKIDLSKYSDPFQLEEILTDVDNIEPGNSAAKASIDIALHDLVGKLLGRPWFEIWGYTMSAADTSFTIGIDSEEKIKDKIKEADEFNILKVKLGNGNDKKIINTIREVTGKPLYADINQGWKDKHQALDLIHWLKEKNVLLIEQPMPKELLDETAWLTERSPLPVIADEAVKRGEDILQIKGAYSGINIKLMKCTGMRKAYKMAAIAKAAGLKIMLGCMTETSCGISAASHLSSNADWLDLDGAMLIKNDPFSGTQIINGKIVVSHLPGIGVTKIKDFA